MKKIIALVIASVLSLGVAAPSFAGTHHQQNNSLNNIYFGH